MKRLLFVAGISCGLLFGQPVPVKGSEQQAKLVKKVQPVYPAKAKAAKIEGVVKLKVTINKDGTVQDIQTISGPDELVKPAVAAVKQWQWKPTTIDNKPVEVITDVDVNYTLEKSAPKSASKEKKK